MRVGKTHDVGLRNAEVVDTAAQYVERSGDSGLGLALQYLLHILVRALEHDVLAIGAHEEGSQRTAVGLTLVDLHEVGDIILRRTALEVGVSLLDGGHKGGILGAVTGQSLDNILHLHLQHDVHTALEVQTQVQLLLFALLVGEALKAHVEHLQVLDRIQVVLLRLGLLLEGERSGILRCLLLYATRLERKRELVNTCQCQQHGDEFDKTFALHFVNLICFYVVFYF